MITKYIRGSVWWVDLPLVRNSSVQSGRRPCIVISNNKNNTYSHTVNILPCTTQSDRLAIIHPDFIMNGKTNYALCEQIRTVDISNLFDYMGVLDEDTMTRVDNALMVQLGIIPNDLKQIEAGLLALNNIMECTDTQSEVMKTETDTKATEIKEEVKKVSDRVTTVINRVSKYDGMTATEKFKTKYGNITDSIKPKKEEKEPPKKTRRKWTTKLIKELLDDADSMSLNDVAKKWKFADRKTAQDYIRIYGRKLNEKVI